VKQIIVGFIKDKHLFFDEKKILGAAYLLALLVAVFALSLEPAVLSTLLAVGVSLYLGVPIGELVPPISGTQGLGIFDLITNKANTGDPFRLFGAVFLLSGLVYTFSPAWTPGFAVRWEYLLLIGLAGLALLGVALYGDKVATNGEPGK